MTVAAGRVAFRQRSFALGVAVVSAQARAGPDRAGRGRRPGGVPQGVPDFERVAEGHRDADRGRRGDRCPDRVTEQYPKGLGETAPEVAEHLPDGSEPLEKVVFSAADAEGFDLGGRDQALVCGIETHVCVNQTVPRPARRRDRGPGRRGRGRLAHRREQAGRAAQDGAGGRGPDQRRDRAVRAARPGRHRRVQARPEADPRLRARIPGRAKARVA